MPYTYKSVAIAWFVIFFLFAVSASGVVRGPWFLLLVAIAAAVPILVLRNSADGRGAVPVGAPMITIDARGRLPSDMGPSDILRWENEGGARRRPLRDRAAGLTP